jgi:hypothetical protein
MAQESLVAAFLFSNIGCRRTSAPLYISLFSLHSLNDGGTADGGTVVKVLCYKSEGR